MKKQYVPGGHYYLWRIHTFLINFANFKLIFSQIIPSQFNYYWYSDSQRKILRILTLIKGKLGGNYWIL